MSHPLPTVAVCAKCGRGFVTEPKSYPAYDPFWPANVAVPRGHIIRDDEICGGEITPAEAHTGSVT